MSALRRSSFRHPRRRFGAIPAIASTLAAGSFAANAAVLITDIGAHATHTGPVVVADVNGKGRIVGWFTGPGGGPQAFTWVPGGALVPLALTGLSSSTAVAVNANDEVVGTRPVTIRQRSSRCSCGRPSRGRWTSGTAPP